MECYSFLLTSLVGFQILCVALSITNSRSDINNQYLLPEKSNLEWENGLKEAIYQILHKQHKNPNLKNYLKAAPIIGRQNRVVPFGDVTVLARGQLYSNPKGFVFVQDPYQNDCEECHNPAPHPCGRDCPIWRSQQDEKLLALWTVKRIRHREPNGSHRFELKYIISPFTGSNSRVILKRDGRFDYSLPGHVFLLRGSQNGNYLQENLKESHTGYEEIQHVFPEYPVPPNHRPDYGPLDLQYPPPIDLFARHRFQPSPIDTRPIIPEILTNEPITQTPPFGGDKLPGKHVVKNDEVIKAKPRQNEAQVYRELIDILRQKLSTQTPVKNTEERPKMIPTTTSSTYATHIKKMQEMVMGHKSTTPTLKPIIVSKQYSRTNTYKPLTVNTKRPSFLPTMKYPPTKSMAKIIPETTTVVPKLVTPWSTTMTPKTTRFELPKNHAYTTLKSTRKIPNTYHYTTTKYPISTKNVFPSTQNQIGYQTQRPRVTSTLPITSPDLEIIPITNQSALLAPILDMLKPIMEMMKTGRPTTLSNGLGNEFTVSKLPYPPKISEIIGNTNPVLTTAKTTPYTSFTTSKNVEIQRSETQFEPLTSVTNQPTTKLIQSQSSSEKHSKTIENNLYRETSTSSIGYPKTNGFNLFKTTHIEENSTPTTQLITKETEPSIFMSKETVIEWTIPTNTETTTTSTIHEEYKTPTNTPTTKKYTTSINKRPKFVPKKKQHQQFSETPQETTRHSKFTDELFGTPKTTTPEVKNETTVVEKLEESNENILNELFENLKNSTPSAAMDARMDYDLFQDKSEENSRSKIIFSNFYFAPTHNPVNITLSEEQETQLKSIIQEPENGSKKLVVEKLNMLAQYTLDEDGQDLQDQHRDPSSHNHLHKVPTAQSVSTSVSYVVTRQNKSESVKKARKPVGTAMVKAEVQKVPHAHDDVIVYQADFPDITNLLQKSMGNKTGENFEPNITKLLNNITLSVVNKAKAKEYIKAERRRGQDRNRQNLIKRHTKL